MAKTVKSADEMIKGLKLTDKYDKEAHQRAYDQAMKNLFLEYPVRIGDPPVYVNTNCCEGVLMPLQTLCPLEVPHLVDVTMGLGAGFSHMGEVCGAVSGAIIAIGLDIIHRYPRGTTTQRLLVSKATQKFVQDVRKEFGSVRCRDLIGHDISGVYTPGDEKYAAFLADKDTSMNQCMRIMRFAILYPLPREQEGQPYSL